MACPNRRQLIRWISGESDPAIDEHILACVSCQNRIESTAVPEDTLRQSLHLSRTEQRFLEQANLATLVRVRVVEERARNTWSLAVFVLGVLGGAITWLIVSPVVALALDVSMRAGAGTIVLGLAVEAALTVVAAVAAITTSPAVDLMPVVATIAMLALWLHLLNVVRPLSTRPK